MVVHEMTQLLHLHLSLITKYKHNTTTFDYSFVSFFMIDVLDISFRCSSCTLVFDSQTWLSYHMYCKKCYAHIDALYNKTTNLEQHATSEVIASSKFIGDFFDNEVMEQLQMDEFIIWWKWNWSRWRIVRWWFGGRWKTRSNFKLNCQ